MPNIWSIPYLGKIALEDFTTASAVEIQICF